MCREDTTIFLSILPMLNFRHLNFCYVPGTILDSRLMWQLSISSYCYFSNHIWVASFSHQFAWLLCICSLHSIPLLTLTLFLGGIFVIVVLVVVEVGCVCMCVCVLWTIFLCTMKLCCSHGFNKEPNGQQVGRKRLGRTCGLGKITLGYRRAVTHQMQRKQDKYKMR